MITRCLLILLAWTGFVQAETRIEVARFSQGDQAAWQERSFVGNTDYRLVELDNLIALQAHSNASASGLYREKAIDLQQTPILHWSWKTNTVLIGNDEQSRDGDDYPLRIYVVFSGGIRFWRTRAINYVWSSHQPRNSEWPNAYTANARMIAVDSDSEGLGQWQHHQRDVLADYRRLFGDEPRKVDAVAIMTDTDNTGQQATGWYGDIWFAEP